MITMFFFCFLLWVIVKCTPTQLGLTRSLLPKTKRDAPSMEIDTCKEKKKFTELLSTLTT